MMSRLVPVLAALGLLSACAGTEPTYYTLLGPLPSAPSAAPVSGWSGFQLRRVDVPSQLDRRPLVLTVPPGAQVRLLNDSQWASPLPDELSLALVSGLQSRLGVPQLADTAGKTPFWRLDVAVQRFESVYGERSTLELSWTLRPVGFKAPSYQCRWLDSEPASSVAELVDAHRRLQSRLADAVAAQMQGTPLPAALVNSATCQS